MMAFGIEVYLIRLGIALTIMGIIQLTFDVQSTAAALASGVIAALAEGFLFGFIKAAANDLKD